MCLAALTATAADHEEKNPIYRELRQKGLSVGTDKKVTLAAPTMPDGLDADGQAKALKALAGKDYDVEDLLRKSLVSPHLLRLGDATPSDPNAPARTVDVWFIAYGDIKKLSNKDFLQNLQNSKKEEGKAEALTAEQLKKRGIAIKAEDEKAEGYGHLVFNFLDRVQLNVTGHSFLTESDESIVIASGIDSRFRDDKELANVWRPLVRDDEGKLKPGDPTAYDGAAYYFKITKLAKPEGALFVEAHVVFCEPKKWFDGANLLRSKLPAVVQSQVRSFRRELSSGK